MSLTHQQLAHVLHSIDRTYDFDAEMDPVDHFAEALRTLIPSTFLSVEHRVQSTLDLRAHAIHPDIPSDQRDVFTHFMHQYPLLDEMKQVQRPGMIRLDGAPGRTLFGTDLFEAYFRYLDVAYQEMIICPLDAFDEMLMLTYSRETPFTESEHCVACHLIPHIFRALRTRQLLHDLDQQSGWFETQLSLTGIAFVEINESLRVVRSSGTAIQWLEEAGPRRAHGLPLNIRESLPPLNGPRTAIGAWELVVHLNDGGTLSLRLAPCESEAQRWRLLLLRRNSEIPKSDDLTSLGITKAQASVLWLVSKGLTNREVAQSLNLSPRTVSTHLTNIYSKIGVSNRTEACQKAQALL